MNSPTTILLADDHPTFLLGLKQALLSDPSFTIICETGNGKDAMQNIVDLSPEIAVIDWDMPVIDGLEITRAVKKHELPTKIVILTMHDEESLVNEAIEAGVNGFVLKDDAVEDILDCLQSVREGTTFLSPAVVHLVVKYNQRRSTLHNKTPGMEKLTPTEKRILLQVADGHSSKEIAAKLSISPRTVETHRRNMCEKLNLQGSHSLLLFATTNRDLL